jgi:uncharacterized protein YcfJ
MKTLTLAVASLAAALAPAAHAAYDRYGNYYESPVYAADTREECWNTRSRRFESPPQRDNRVGAGTAIGAIAGGVIGHQVGSGRGNDAATVGGALLGGLLGHQVEKDRRADNVDFDMTRCRTVASAGSSTYSYAEPYRNEWR